MNWLKRLFRNFATGMQAFWDRVGWQGLLLAIVMGLLITVALSAHR